MSDRQGVQAVAERIYLSAFRLHQRSDVRGFVHNCIAHPAWWMATWLTHLVGIDAEPPE